MQYQHTQHNLFRERVSYAWSWVEHNRKKDKRSYVVDAMVVPEKIECAAFVGIIEARVINKNLADITLHTINLLVNETEEYRSVKEANPWSNLIGNLAESSNQDVNMLFQYA